MGQASGIVATATITVKPAIFLFPSSGKVGTHMTMVGVGFGAKETVAALLYLNPGFSLLGSSTSNTVGTAVVTFTVPSKPLGTYYVIGYGVSSKVFAFAPFTVTDELLLDSIHLNAAAKSSPSHRLR